MNLTRSLLLTALAVAFLVSASQAATVYWAMTADDEIYSAPADGSGTPTIVVSPATGNTYGPVGFDIDFGNGLIYVNDGNERETYVQPLDGSGAPTLLPNSTDDSGEHFMLVLDLPNSRYFFTNDSTDGLWSGNIDGTGSLFQISSNGLSNYHGLDYDPLTDLLYAGTTDGDNQIWRYKSDGTMGTLLFDSTDGVTGARGVALDLINGRIYWAQHDAGNSDSGKLMSGALDGTGTPVVLRSLTGRVFPADLQVHDGRLYWTEFDSPADTSQVLSAAIGSGGTSLTGTTVLYDAGEKIRGILVTGQSSAVVPVPAALPVGLIGLFGIALYRRIRRKD